MIDDLLTVLRPDADDSALLAACLKTGDEAASAWESWRARRDSSTETLRTQLAARRNLLPLLERSVRRNGLRVEPVLLDYLRAATLREQLRATRFRTIAAEVLSTLDRAGVAAWASRGVALAATVYDDHALRHCHDLDLLVEGGDVGVSRAALRAMGLHDVDPREAARFSVPGHVPPGAVLRHESGLHVVLHTRPFGVAFYHVALSRFVAGGERATVDGQAIRIPAAEALLVHVLGHATYSSTRRNLRWITDAWHLLHRRRDIDWSEVENRLAECRMSLAVSVLLDYMTDFGMPVPRGHVERVRQHAFTLSPSAADVALGGAVSACGGDVGVLWGAAQSIGGRAHLLRWMLAPSAAYVRSAFPESRSEPIALAYLRRPVRFLRGRRSASAPGDLHA